VDEVEKQRKFELEKLKVESETKENEIEAATKQREMDLNAQIEREKAEREADFQLKRLQMELAARVRESQSNTSVDGNGDHAVSHVSNIKLMKLPPFHEEKDDLDAYLNRFERTCRAFNEPQGQWSLLKNSLLKRFRLTEEGYRKRFKRVRIEVGETAEQFVDRLKKYLAKWREMVGFDATYEGLQNMIPRDQFFITCDNRLQTFLKEKGKLNLKEMTQAIL